MISQNEAWYWKIIGKLVAEKHRVEDENERLREQYRTAQEELKDLSERNGFQALTIVELKTKLECGDECGDRPRDDD